jgi:drug/metabolite transporter (DMT)-like permease
VLELAGQLGSCGSTVYYRPESKKIMRSHGFLFFFSLTSGFPAIARSLLGIRQHHHRTTIHHYNALAQSCPRPARTVLQVTLDHHQQQRHENATEIDSDSISFSFDKEATPTTTTASADEREYKEWRQEDFFMSSTIPDIQSTTCTTKSNGNQTSTTYDADDRPSSILGMTPNAMVALNTVAIIWGSQHAVIKMVVEDAEAGPFTLLRFAIGASVASLPLLWMKQTSTSMRTSTLENDMESTTAVTATAIIQPAKYKNGNQQTVWRWGAEMGFWMFLGFAFQAVGLATTTAQRSGFLLYLNVKFVPFFAFLLFGKQISIATWISALTAFAGTALLSYDGTSWSLNQGDLWTIAAACASAMYILRLDTAANAVGNNNSVQLNAACLWIVTLLSALWSVMTVEDVSLLVPQLQRIVIAHPLELIYLSAVTTALANYIQTMSQKEVSAERASVIYAMDPVYGAAFSNILLGETLTSLGFIGAGLIAAAAATNALLDLGEQEEKSEATYVNPNDKLQ